MVCEQQAKAPVLHLTLNALIWNVYIAIFQTNLSVFNRVSLCRVCAVFFVYFYLFIYIYQNDNTQHFYRYFVDSVYESNWYSYSFILIWTENCRKCVCDFVFSVVFLDCLKCKLAGDLCDCLIRVWCFVYWNYSCNFLHSLVSLPMWCCMLQCKSIYLSYHGALIVVFVVFLFWFKTFRGLFWVRYSNSGPYVYC